METKIDLFTAIHKAIRALLYETGKQLQTANLADAEEMHRTLNWLEQTIDMLEEHGKHEDELIFPPIENAVPGSTEEAESQHRGYVERVLRLREVIGQIRHTADASLRVAKAGVLNRRFTDFMAFYLMHMNCEEETVLQVSQDKLSNEELTAIRVKVQTSIPPQRYAEWLQWMLPSLSLQELVPLLSQVKASAPAPVVEKFKAIGQTTIDRARWEKLQQLVQL
jgi:hemerythrin-like domain-containing protein